MKKGFTSIIIKHKPFLECRRGQKFFDMVSGFTLIELLIYITILGFILASMTGFFWNNISGNIKEQSYQEVQQNGRFALIKIGQEIKKAVGINSPLPGSSSNSLSLIMSDSQQNPTIFSLNGEKLVISQGTSGLIELTSDQVRITNLQFINLSYFDTPGTVRVEMTIENLNPGDKSEYQASLDLKTTISLLQE